MLTSEQSIVRCKDGRAEPDRLMRGKHGHYLSYAKRMLAVYRSGAGLSRRELHRSVAAIFAHEPDCERRRISAFCKLLDDAGEFETDRRGEAAALRLKVFSMAAANHPLVSQADGIFDRTEAQVKAMIAAECGQSWEAIDSRLYVDVMDHQPLCRFAGYGSEGDFLAAYNLAQLQACLYKCTRLSVEASADFSAVVRFAKLARLLVEARRISRDVYRIDLSGPASVLQETRRYGVNFARFVGALVSCRQWRMRAEVMTPWGRGAALMVSDGDGYRTHVAAPLQFDSSVEETLAESWGEVRDGWRLLRQAGILQHGQTTFVPDFLLRHEDGREVFFEIVGFWTPEYLAAKRKTLAMFRDRRIVLAIQRKSANRGESSPGVVVYKTRIRPEDVLGVLAAVE